ncbi:hypothetical protein AB0I81_57240 [Nonomuraea sp. NPDC050404]|uniref:hypothetical protein n=1 Tax=Nonomuraea sp. NPDC050404 TaxID=3155783 RepID=UPI0033EFE83B
MEFQGWSDGLALRPRDYLGKGESLAAVVRAGGPFAGESLYLFALGTAATMARMHLGGIAGLRLSPAGVLIGPRGQAFFAPGPRDSEFPASDVMDWADVVVFAATGTEPGERRDGVAEPDLDRLLPALRAVIEECRRSDPASRPSAVDLVRVLLGHSGAARGATVHELLCEAEWRTRPEEPPPAYEERVVVVPFWRKPAYLGGIAIGVLIVATVAGAVTMVSGRAAGPPPDAGAVYGAIGRHTVTFHHVSEVGVGKVVADGRLSFDANAATAYDMKITCGNAPDPAGVSLVGNAGVADGVRFDAAQPPPRPPTGSCARDGTPFVRDYSSPHAIKALIDAAGPDVTSTPAAGNGRTITGTAMAHRIRGEEGLARYSGAGIDGPVRFTLLVDARGLPARLELRTERRGNAVGISATTYRDWRAFEAIKGETPNG